MKKAGEQCCFEILKIAFISESKISFTNIAACHIFDFKTLIFLFKGHIFSEYSKGNFTNFLARIKTEITPAYFIKYFGGNPAQGSK